MFNFPKATPPERSLQSCNTRKTDESFAQDIFHLSFTPLFFCRKILSFLTFTQLSRAVAGSVWFVEQAQHVWVRVVTSTNTCWAHTVCNRNTKSRQFSRANLRTSRYIIASQPERSCPYTQPTNTSKRSRVLTSCFCCTRHGLLRLVDSCVSRNTFQHVVLLRSFVCATAGLQF